MAPEAARLQPLTRRDLLEAATPKKISLRAASRRKNPELETRNQLSTNTSNTKSATSKLTRQPQKVARQNVIPELQAPPPAARNK